METQGAAGPYLPSTRLIHRSGQLEGLLKVVEADHLLIQCVHLNATQVARESERFRGLQVKCSQGTLLPPRTNPAQTAGK